jgi:pimeloyl-ACP methyl ester carboxylesterase
MITRIGLLLSLCAMSCSITQVGPVPVVPQHVAIHEHDVRFRSGEIELAGLLLVPAAAGRHPAAMFIQGSGASDRSNAWARGIAEALARRGIVVLLPDKRGTGASKGDWRRAGYEDYALDAIAGVRFLQAMPEVDADFTGIVGLSQGGQIAPLAADLSDEVAFVINVSGSATTPGEQVNHEMRNTFRQAGLPPEGVETGMKLQSLAEQYVRSGSWEPYAGMLAALAESPLAPIAAGFPQTEDSWVWGWWRGIGDYDPIDHWRVLDQPSLVVYGKDDELDNVPVERSVQRLEEVNAARDNRIEIAVFEGSGHALYAPGTSRLREEFTDLLVRWVHRQHRGLRGHEFERQHVPSRGPDCEVSVDIGARASILQQGPACMAVL